MATTTRNARDRRARKLENQHNITPFKTKADLSILEDYDFSRFFRHLKRKAPCPLHVKIEQTAGSRPHFHITSTTSITKTTMTALITSCLQGEKIDLHVEDFDPKFIKEYCHYISKDTFYKGRCERTTGKFWAKNPYELSKMSDHERRQKLMNALLFQEGSSCQRLRDYYFMGVLKGYDIYKNTFLTVWHRFLQYDPHLAQVEDIALKDNCWEL